MAEEESIYPEDEEEDDLFEETFGLDPEKEAIKAKKAKEKSNENIKENNEKIETDLNEDIEEYQDEEEINKEYELEEEAENENNTEEYEENHEDIETEEDENELDEDEEDNEDSIEEEIIEDDEELEEDQDNKEEDEDELDEDENETEEEAEIEKDETDEEEKEITIPKKEIIKKTILDKAAESAIIENNSINKLVTGAQPPLQLLEGDSVKNAFIGRKKSVFEKYGMMGALQLGRVKEGDFPQKDVYLDGLNPHVVFVCGARGSGKSYVLGVIAEELATKNKNVATVVIDPVGVFWSMKFPNKEEKELELLAKWGMEPEGLDNLVVFIPKGMQSETPKSTYNNLFSMKPSLLTGQDWALTFGIDRFSPSGLLLERALTKVKRGFKDIDGKKIEGKGDNFSIDDLILCLERDKEINSREKGFKADSVRALVSRFEAAKTWGIFDSRGTPLAEICKEGVLTVIDTSFLEDEVSALVIGILSRRILAARKLTTRKEAAKQFDDIDVDQLLELEIPPTWLFIDEAHTLIPSGNTRTPATDALVEYVKQGRRPGCSLVFATQQPSAINSKVLSQLDIIMTHKLVFNDDVKAVFKRTPTIIPRQFKASNFIKTLPVGMAVTGDRREESSRAFIMKIRPRKSQHEGRDAETIGQDMSLSNDQILKLAEGMIWKKLEGQGEMELDDVETTLETLNTKYKGTAKFNTLIKRLEKRGATVIKEENKIIIEEVLAKFKESERVSEEMDKRAFGEDDDDEEDDTEEETTEEDENLETDDITNDEEDADEIETEEDLDIESTVELLAFPQKFNEQNATKLFEKERKKRLFGLIGDSERLDEYSLKHLPIYKINFNLLNENGSFKHGKFFINSQTGEFLHFTNGEFIESKGLKNLYSTKDDELILLNEIGNKPRTYKDLEEKTGFGQTKITRIVNKLVQDNILKKGKLGGHIIVEPKTRFDLPKSPLVSLLSSLNQMEFETLDAPMIMPEKYNKKQVTDLLKRIWPKMIITKISEVYWPVYEAIYSLPNGKTRKLLIDAVTGKKLNLKKIKG